MVTNYEGDEIKLKEQLPLLPIRDVVVYPFMIVPLFVGREASIKAVEEACNNTERLILLAGQKDISAENPAQNEIFEVGTVAMIMRMRRLPDGRVKILVQGLCKAKILEFSSSRSFYQVKVEKVEDSISQEPEASVEALVRNVRDHLEKITAMGTLLSPDILMVLEDIQEPGRIADLIAYNLGLKVEESQMILEMIEPVERLQRVDEILQRELEILLMQAKIRGPSRPDLSDNQKKQFLRDQIKVISDQLGDENGGRGDEFSEMKDKIQSKKMPTESENEALKQLGRLERMHPDSSESSILRTYLEWLIDIPWNESSEEITDLTYAEAILDEDHFDLRKIKERILEYLAVRSLKGPKMKGPILCFAGPPGVGKTSLGKSIAKATGRKYVRVSLGGLKDESEMRGHRRTYVGAMPGRFIQALKQAGTNNPVVVLDEIDKLGSDYRGDPSSAMLEVLDPEQNHSFRDHYLNLPYDLSNVMFIATANILENIPAPLRDRMEIIKLAGYSHKEKLAISKRFLVPKQMDENGIGPENIEFSDEGIESVIQSFTREAGLRNLERQLGSLCRKIARKVAGGDKKKTLILENTVEDLLGPAQFSSDEIGEHDEIGVVTGLAWTAAGGEILNIEASKSKGKGLVLTGQLGDVMKESAQAAWGHVRAHAAKLGFSEEVFEKFETHLHLPAGAIPKDGPSAGITLATALVSLYTGKAVSKKVAMTGEITLTGKVLPVGGIKEKALAAMRYDVPIVLIPAKNEKDLIDIPAEYREKVQFIPVKTFQEVLKYALVHNTDQKETSSKKKRPASDKKKDGTRAAA